METAEKTTKSKAKVKQIAAAEVKGTPLVPQNGAMLQQPQINQEAIKAAEEKFDAIQKELAETTFEFRMRPEVAENFQGLVDKFSWKGYGALAVEKLSEFVQTTIKNAGVITEDGEYTFAADHAMLEVLVNHINRYESKGVKSAIEFRQIADAIVPALQKMNQIRQDLADQSIEVEAAKHGITPDQYIAALQKSQSQQR